MAEQARASFWSRITWAAGIVTFIGSALWAAITYSHNNRIVYEKPLLDKQVALCFQISETVGTLVATDESNGFSEKQQEFWRCYWGPLVMVEGPALARAMVAMGKELNAANFEGRQSLSTYALDVARECRQQIETTLDEGW